MSKKQNEFKYRNEYSVKTTTIISMSIRGMTTHIGMNIDWGDYCYRNK